ncbi:hypothetical protein GGP72_000175 [Salinibacter ruber]|jgi:hypothetical protein|uniref:Uncharacterized protein n=1 Tax=Salinibacter ruber TaxID=146919 RepID=A0A9X2PTK5_9BACT|nr:hypothetical protein [Salinibacter ruber]MCS3676279.1 hypothetical protein [Salinibacter ruber]MCS3679566.1 hypothetical protein [Salinibacter ruber]
MQNQLHPNALGLSLALLSGLCMLVLGLFGLLGIYEGAVQMMTDWHLFFSADAVGILTGILEGAFWGYVLGVLTAVFYNWFVPGTRSESG